MGSTLLIFSGLGSVIMEGFPQGFSLEFFYIDVDPIEMKQIYNIFYFKNDIHVKLKEIKLYT